MTKKLAIKSIEERLDEFNEKLDKYKRRLDKSMIVYGKFKSIEQTIKEKENYKNQIINLVDIKPIYSLKESLLIGLAPTLLQSYGNILRSNEFQTPLIALQDNVRQSVHLLSNYYSNYVVPNILAILAPIIQVQLEFNTIINKSLYITSDIVRQSIIEWAKLTLSLSVDLKLFRFNFEYTQEKYTEKHQVVINLKDGKKENDFIEYQDVEFEGQDFQVLLVPKTKYKDFKNQYTSLSVDYGNKSLFIGSATNHVNLQQFKTPFSLLF